jgi:hypothetical protein
MRRHRLVGADVEIDNRKAPMAQTYPSVVSALQSCVIGPAMSESIAHALDNLGLDRRSRNGANDAAHQS